MTVVVLKMIALILERVESFILNLPASASASHHWLDRARGERQVGDPSPARDLTLLVRLLIEQVIDPHIRRAVAHTQAAGPGEIMLLTSRINFAQFFDLAGGATSGELFFQARVRIRFDVQNVMPAVAPYLTDVRGVGIERIFDQNRLEIRILLVQ